MTFPAKKHETLEYLRISLRMSHEELLYVIKKGFLKTSIWLPLRHVKKSTCDGKRLLKGYVGIHSKDAEFIVKHGYKLLQEFISSEQNDVILNLVDGSISVGVEDLLVLKTHIEEFTQTYEINDIILPKIFQENQDDKLLEFKVLKKDYSKVDFREMIFTLGPIQRKIVKQLHEVALNKDPWIRGKTLTTNAGTESRLRDIFKDKDDWDKMIKSNGNGSYCLASSPHA